MSQNATSRRAWNRHRRLAILVFAAGGAATCYAALQIPEVPRIEDSSVNLVSQDMPIQPPSVESTTAALPPVPQEPPTDHYDEEIARVVARQREIETQIAESTAQLQANEADRKAAEAKIASLTTRLGELPERIPSQASETETTSELAELESLELDLAAKLNDSHPRLVALRQQIADARKTADSQPEGKPFDRTELDTKRRSLQSELDAERIKLAALVRRQEELIESRALLRGEVAALRIHAESINKRREAASAENAPPIEPVRVIAAAPSEPAVEPAQLSTLSFPTGLRRLFVLTFGLAVSLAAAIVSALLAARRNPLIASAAQLQAIWDVPLAGVIPGDAR
jgi:hypothetical protein